MKFFAIFATLLAVTCAQQQWTLNELSAALQDPNTPAELVPYLEDALNTMMANIINGEQQEAIVVATPVGLLPVEAVAPGPVVAPASSPLVQIIVNVNQQEGSVAAPSPVFDWVAPVRPEPEQSFVPVNPVDVIAITPPQAIINPIEVIDVVAVATPEVNPIDVVAVAAPEVNPIDILSPVPAVAGLAPVVGPIM